MKHKPWTQEENQLIFDSMILGIDKDIVKENIFKLITSQLQGRTFASVKYQWVTCLQYFAPDKYRGKTASKRTDDEVKHIRNKIDPSVRPVYNNNRDNRPSVKEKSFKNYSNTIDLEDVTSYIKDMHDKYQELLLSYEELKKTKDSYVVKVRSMKNELAAKDNEIHNLSAQLSKCKHQIHEDEKRLQNYNKVRQVIKDFQHTIS